MTVIDIIREHLDWRRQIFKLAKADLVKTYSGAALGWAWAIIKPAVTIFIYWFAFSSGFRESKGIEGYPFFLWLLAGIVSWFYISEMVSQGASAMRTYKHLVTKMKFPISTIPTFVSLSKLVIHLILISVTVAIFIIAGETPTIYILQLPVYMLLMFMFCTGWYMFASMLGAVSVDFINLVKAFMTALFWLSGIMFNMAAMDSKAVQIFFRLNPISFTVEGYRNCFIHHKWFWQEPKWMLVYLCELAVMWILAIWSYKRLKKEIPDIL